MNRRPHLFCSATSRKLGCQSSKVGAFLPSIVSSCLNLRPNLPYSVGIVVLDEADKLARRSSASSDSSRDVSGEGVQQGLLRMLEGSVVSDFVLPLNRVPLKHISTGFSERKGCRIRLGRRRYRWIQRLWARKRAAFRWIRSGCSCVFDESSHSPPEI